MKFSKYLLLSRNIRCTVVCVIKVKYVFGCSFCVIKAKYEIRKIFVVKAKYKIMFIGNL